MARKATGAPFFSRGQWYARIVLAEGIRKAFILPACTRPEDEPRASERARGLAQLAGDLRAAGEPAASVEAFMERAAVAEGRGLAVGRAAVAHVCSSRVVATTSDETTFHQFGERWTNGELAREFPDHVKKKRTSDKDKSRFDNHVYPVMVIMDGRPMRVGDLPLRAFTLDHALAVMAVLPEPGTTGGAPASRRHVAQSMHRLLGIAVFPARLIQSNPLPKGFLPKLGPEKAKAHLYPDEDAQLLGARAVPLPRRVFYGFLAREGPRESEATGLDVRDVDVKRGMLVLDKNKTDDARAWAMGPDVTRGLRAWFKIRERQLGRKLLPGDPVFVDEKGERISERHLAEVFREDLIAAKIERETLFERSEVRRRIWLHDLRGTFVTIALANGKTETWVQDRTGHKSSVMVNKYRRAARQASELGLGPLRPLDEAIPELREESERGSGIVAAAGGIVAAMGGEGPRAARGHLRKRREKRASRSLAIGHAPFKIHGPRGRPGSTPGGATRRDD